MKTLLIKTSLMSIGLFSSAFADSSVHFAQTDTTAGGIGKVYLILIALLLLATFILWLVKKKLPKNHKFNALLGNINVKEKKRLSNRLTLYIVECEGKKLLIAEHSQNVEIRELGE
ncbi:MAG: flagellar biosynthetic protein FliO [Francisellaceae bacterium]